MSTITIRHTYADGTLIEDSRRGDGVWETLKALHDNWKYRRNVGLFLGLSRDVAPQMWKIDRAADALRAAGHEVDVQAGDTEPRPVADVEADRADRAADRAGRLADRAERVGADAEASYARARQMASVIPFGQPAMPDHYSYRRDMNYRDKIHRTYGRAFAGMDEAAELARRAASAETEQSHRESVPATLRRIGRLETEQRDVTRKLAGRPDHVPDGNGGYTWKLVKPGARWKAQLDARAAALAAELDYWRGHVAAAEAAGAKVWTAADFTRGDFTVTRGTWAEVLRVNPKSVTIAYGVNVVNRPVVRKADAGGSTWKLPYDKVTARRSAAEQAAADTPATTDERTPDA